MDNEHDLVPAGDGLIQMAQLNVTYGVGGELQNGDLPDLVQWEAAEGDILAIATEALRAGSIPGIGQDENASLVGFRVERFKAEPDRPFNRLVIRPKAEFGS